jgi:translation initiation factor IF-2
MKNGVLVTANQNVDGDTAELVVIEFGHTVKRVSDSDVEIGLIDNVDNSKGKARAPIVTIMGHVDHGKTSLLDAIRATDVVGKESGGITQHIGAYQIVTTNQQKITFIDTPGHAAFSSMRARGANITDIIVLVVAADDSVMPQTIEAIQHAKEASVPIVLAINKIDVEGSNPTKVKQDLLQHEIVTEDMGGEVVVVEVSAIKKKNLDELIESILLQAELLDLKAVYEGPSSGVVLESRVDIGRGIVSNILVSRGTLKIGDIVVAGANWGKVRALMNDKGERIDSAEPTVPVEVLGLNDIPQAGDQYAVVDSEYRAREVANYRKQAALKKNNQSLRGAEVISADQMLNQIKEGKRKILPIILKTDVHGSMEAINSSLKEIEHEEVAAQVVLSGVGALNESDLMLALTSNAVVMGFNVRADMPAKKIAKQNNIEIKYYSVIYELIDDVKNLLSGLMAPIQKESFLGYASIKKIFKISKVGKIAGCEVTEGTVKKGAKVRLLRDNVVVHEGDLSTLKHHQNEVKEVKQGVECGMSLANYDNIKEGDLIECFEIKSEKRTL